MELIDDVLTGRFNRTLLGGDAIAEASHRPKASFVPVKSLEQQDLQSLQRIRERLIKHRTATGNQLRGLLAEYGVVIPKGLCYLRA